MSSFKNLSDEDKRDFSKWMRHQLLRGFLHRLSGNEQQVLLFAFCTVMRDVVKHADFQAARELVTALKPRTYTESEAIDIINDCLDLVISAEQDQVQDASVYHRLTLIERYVALFYSTLFKE